MKGVELSMNFIIIAVIALVVLLLAVLLVTGAWKNFVGGTNDCESTGGQCMSECPSGALPRFGAKCADSTDKCCVG